MTVCERLLDICRMHSYHTRLSVLMQHPVLSEMHMRWHCHACIATRSPQFRCQGYVTAAPCFWKTLAYLLKHTCVQVACCSCRQKQGGAMGVSTDSACIGLLHITNQPQANHGLQRL